MENNDENRDLIRNFLLALSSMYSDEKVDVDKSVFNAARIWKLYGTLAVKGDDLPDRPHRLSKILDLPPKLKPVPVEKIKWIANFYTAIDKKDKSNFNKYDSSFSVEEFIKKHEIEVYREKPFCNNGKLWVIKCPMNEEHTDKSAHILQFSNGAIQAGCKHNSCSGWVWKDLRMKFEPDCYNKKSPNVTPPPQHLEKYHNILKPHYGIDGEGRLYTMERREENFVKKNLSNFIAVPIEDIVKYDGFQERKYLKIKGFINDEELPDLTINASDFATMSWITNWGLKANIFSCYGSRDKVRDCTQRLSCFSKKITLFSHLGWKKINDTWSYLHSGGSIGAENINVDLEKDGFENYILKNPKGFDSKEIQTAMKESLELLALHKDSFIIWGICYLTPLCEALRQVNHEPGFSLWIRGRSGSQKSTLSALFLNHFGQGFNVTNLPASFKDTPNAIEKRAAVCKDSLFIIDDFKPSTSNAESNNMVKKAREMLWSYSNRTGRQRMNGDTSVRKAYIPRGIAIFTGEDTPACGGESTIARYLCIELKRKEIDLNKLKECQENSLSLNIAMSAYIEWIGKNMDTLIDKLKVLFEQFREEAINKLDSHNRFHEIVAWMKIGLQYGLKFAEEIGAITEEEGNQLLESHTKRLFEIIATQELETGDEKISVKFINAMAELMNSGQVETKPVPNCKSWEDETDDTEKGNYYKAKNIGWHDHEFYYLFPQLSYSAISQFYHRQGLSFGVSPNTLWKELNIEGVIIATEKNRNTFVKKINGKNTRVLKIPKVIIEEQETA